MPNKSDLPQNKLTSTVQELISNDELELIEWRAGRGCHFEGGFLSESKHAQTVIENDVPLLIAEIRRLKGI